MAASKCDVPTELQCPVCHEDYTVPKILQCAHIVCRSCLIRWLDAKAGTQPHCPLCRDPITDTAREASQSEQIADTFPTDLAMEARVECAALLRKDHKCGGCEEKQATSICLNCGDLLCDGCARIHRKMTVSRSHKVEVMKSLTPDLLASARRPACHVHADRPSEFYCPDHSAHLCYTCFKSEHRTCLEVADLEEKMAEVCDDLTELLGKLKAGEENMREAIAQLEQCLTIIRKEATEAEGNVNKKCDELLVLVQAQRQRLLGIIRRDTSQAAAAVQDGKNHLTRRHVKLASHTRLVNGTLQSLPPVCVVGNTVSSLQARVSKLDFSVFLPHDSMDIIRSELIFDQKIVQSMKDNLSNLAKRKLLPHWHLTCKPLKWRFHENHGTNITLSDDGATAEKSTGVQNAILLSSQPMCTKMLYEVQVKEKYDGGHVLWCGITETDPAALTLPPQVPEGWPSAVVINATSVWDYGTQEKSDVGKGLKGVPVGGRVGLLVDSSNSLHLYVNGVDKGVASQNVTHPCYAFFQPYHSYKTVTALPLTKIRQHFSSVV